MSFCAAIAALILVLVTRFSSGTQGASVGKSRLSKYSAVSASNTIVSYAYFESDDIQRKNLEFFLKMVVGPQTEMRTRSSVVDIFVVVSGETCSPCAHLYPSSMLSKESSHFVQAVWTGDVTLLQRRSNVGMDFGAHNATLEWLMYQGRLQSYKYFIFLNSSVRGPFYPNYMPLGWRWTDAFTMHLTKDTKLVGSSIVCLPSTDVGGYGPKVESWAFAVDNTALKILIHKEVFSIRTCKDCPDGIIVKAEYEMSKVILEAGFNLHCLMSRYLQSTDWRNESNWNCNDNVHPSRHGTYGGISLHPFETIFVKSTWHVGEPHLSRYTRWFLDHKEGIEGTNGIFNRDLYEHAICDEGLHPKDTETLFEPKFSKTCTARVS